MELQNKHKIKRETQEEKEHWDGVEYIMALIKGWALIIMWYVPLFTQLGINNKDIKKHFKELVEAYTGEEIYYSKKIVQKNKMS